MIEWRALCLAYPGGPVLRFPDALVPGGGVMLVRGRSGAGKSTLLALLAGLLTPTEGRLVVHGEEPAALAPAARDAWRARTLGFMPQRLHLSEALTVEQNVALAGWASAEDVSLDEVGRWVARLGLEAVKHRRPQSLSVGQAQRVALARAVLRRPRVLVADEPTASLDDEAAHEALGVLREAAGEVGATLVIATHDTRVVQALGRGAVEVRL